MGRRNPNGYGCVTKLKANRSRPWLAKVTIYDEQGHAKQTPIGYAETEEKANILLAEYNNNPWDIDREKVTLVVLYQRWSEIKLPKLGKSNQQSLRSAFKHCSKYYGVKYRSLKSYQMQDCIDNCGCGYSTQWSIKNLFGHLDRFAFEIDLIDKMYSQITTAPPIPDTTREPFTPEQVNIKDWYFEGGIKTAAGKCRIVPIHDRIKPFVKALVDEGNKYLFTYQGKKFSQANYYKCWGEVMEKIGADKTPHEARHTFETNLDNAKGNRKCIDMLMGHKSKDVGNRVYNHKTIEQLRETIALLK